MLGETILVHSGELPLSYSFITQNQRIYHRMRPTAPALVISTNCVLDLHLLPQIDSAYSHKQLVTDKEIGNAVSTWQYDATCNLSKVICSRLVRQ